MSLKVVQSCLGARDIYETFLCSVQICFSCEACSSVTCMFTRLSNMTVCHFHKPLVSACFLFHFILYDSHVKCVDFLFHLYSTLTFQRCAVSSILQHNYSFIVCAIPYGVNILVSWQLMVNFSGTWSSETHNVCVFTAASCN